MMLTKTGIGADSRGRYQSSKTLCASERTYLSYEGRRKIESNSPLATTLVKRNWSS